MKKTIILSTLLLATQLAQADPMGKMPPGRHQPPSVEQRIQHMTERLSLTEEQAYQATEIMNSHQQERDELAARLKELHDQEREQIGALLTDEQKALLETRHHRPLPGQ